jgi:hypothetical protein
MFSTKLSKRNCRYLWLVLPFHRNNRDIKWKVFCRFPQYQTSAYNLKLGKFHISFSPCTRSRIHLERRASRQMIQCINPHRCTNWKVITRTKCHCHKKKQLSRLAAQMHSPPKPLIVTTVFAEPFGHTNVVLDLKLNSTLQNPYPTTHQMGIILRNPGFPHHFSSNLPFHLQGSSSKVHWPTKVTNWHFSERGLEFRRVLWF